MPLFQSNLRKQIRNLPKILQFVKIIHYYSELFTSLLSWYDPGGVWGRQAGRARSRLYRRRFLQVNTRWNSSRRDLHNALLCTVLESNPKNEENHRGNRSRGIRLGEEIYRSLISIFSSKIVNIFRGWINEYSLIQSQTLRILHFFCEFLMNFFPDFAPNSRK